MLSDRYHLQSQDLLASSSYDDGVQNLESSLTTLDFCLLDNIDVYLSSIQPTKASKVDSINDSFYNDSQHLDELLSTFDLDEFDELEKQTDFPDTALLDDIEIEKYISEASFPTPITDTDSSPLSNSEDSTSIIPSPNDGSSTSVDMIVPPSPSLSSPASSSIPSKKRTRLSPLERKLRKKDQNKTAAERYRLKKKSERHELLDRHQFLKNQNQKLKSELEKLTYRVQNLKQFFSDMIQTEL